MQKTLSLRRFVLFLLVTVICLWHNRFGNSWGTLPLQASKLSQLKHSKNRHTNVLPTVKAAGKGNPWINFSDGCLVESWEPDGQETNFRLVQDEAKPLGLASGDFNEDGVPDVVSAYGTSIGGILIVHSGNLDAIFPNNPAAQLRRSSGTFSDSPFLPVTERWELPQAPDLVGTGDFDNDGHLDVVTAKRGASQLCLATGNGRGQLKATAFIQLTGAVTALTAGEINRKDGLVDIAVGVVGPTGPRVFVFEGPNGALRHAPEEFFAPAPVTSFVMAQLGGDYTFDLAFAAGNTVSIISGRDRKLSMEPAIQAEVPPADQSQREFPFVVRSMTTGDFSPARQTDLALLTDEGQVWVLTNPLSIEKNLFRTDAPRLDIAGWKSSLLAVELLPDAYELVRGRVSSLPGDDLIALDRKNLEIHILSRHSDGPQADTISAIQAPVEHVALSVPHHPSVAVLPMRLNSDALNDLVVLREGPEPLSVLRTEPLNTYTVINTNDSGPGSFRQALIDANNNAGADAINFNIPGSGPFTINILGQAQNGALLPIVSSPVSIDGTTQPGFAGFPLIEVSGHQAQTGGTFFINSGNTVIRGLVWNRFSGSSDFQLETNGNNVVEGNYIGLNQAGTNGFPNNSASALTISNGSENIVGGTVSEARNVIGGYVGIAVFFYSGGNYFQGNYIGSNAAGTDGIAGGNGSLFRGDNRVGGTTTDSRNLVNGSVICQGGLYQGNYLGTTFNGTQILSNSAGFHTQTPGVTTIGGTSAGARNLITGNTNYGILVGAENTLIQNNYIGTNVDGLTALPNRVGIEVRAATSTIGGTLPEARNLISGNLESGIVIKAPNITIQSNFVGVNMTGASGLGNGRNGVLITTGGFTPNNNIIGGSISSSGNVISGNGLAGIQVLTGDFQMIAGNKIGVAADGINVISNQHSGIQLVVSHRNTIGGSFPEARNIISGNQSGGILIDRGNDNEIVNNLIGVGEDGKTSKPNTGRGIDIVNGNNNRIGGNSSAYRNVIAGNLLSGVLISGNSNTVSGNFIGIGADGETPAPNREHGISIQGGNNNTIGGINQSEGNLIAYNGTTVGNSGLEVAGGIGNTIRGNSLLGNNGLGIDLGGDGVTLNDQGDADAGPNNLQNYPLIQVAIPEASSTTVQGKLNSLSNHTFIVDFYANQSCDSSGFGEGKAYLGSTMVLSDANGDGTFSVTLPVVVPRGQGITATATDANGSTSEFSRCVLVGAPGIVSFTPAQGTYGSTVTLTGGNFTGVTDVQFTSVSTASFVVASDTQLTAVVPAGASSGLISVTGPDGTGVSQNEFSIQISTAQTIDGALTMTDRPSPRRVDRFADFYSFVGTAGLRVALDLNSTAFDSYLYLIGPTGTLVAEDNDGGPGFNARIPENQGFFRLPQTGIYTIEVTSFEPNGLGPYSFILTQSPPTVFPTRGGNTGNVTLTVVYNNGLVPGATAKLTRTGQSDVLPEFVHFLDTSSLEVNFSLNGKATGLWDLVISYPDGTTITLPNTFTIEAGRKEFPAVSLLGRGAIRPGIPQLYTVVVSNPGNVDLYGVPLTLETSPEITITFQGNIGVPQQPTVGPPIDYQQIPPEIPASGHPNGKKSFPLIISRISPGTSEELTFRLSVPAGQPLNSNLSVNVKTGLPLLSSSLQPVRAAEPSNECLATVGKTAFSCLGLLPGASCLDSFVLFGLNTIYQGIFDFPVGFHSTFYAFKQVSVGALQTAFGCLAGSIPGVGTLISAAQCGWGIGNTINDCVLAGPSAGTSVRVVNSFDPNDKTGPAGPGTERFVRLGQTHPFTIFFENLETATAAAQSVTITDQIDLTKFDVATFTLGTITFGNRSLQPPPGLQFYTREIDLRPAVALVVRVDAEFNPTTGLATWRFDSLDPVTLQPTEDPDIGFLPPNITSPEGEGSVSFAISPKSNLAAGTQLRNQASIVFDTNPAIVTPEWLTTIDPTAPIGQVQALAATQNSTTFLVQWSGTDVGAGILDYSVYVSENGGSFAPFQLNTSNTNAVFTGTPGRTYGFYCIARDKVGNIEVQTPASEATTTVSPTAAGLSVSRFMPIASFPGKTIFITGTGFLTGNTEVFFGGTRLIPAAGVTVTSPTQLQVVIPASSNGTGNINGYLTLRVNGGEVTTQNLATDTVSPCGLTASFPEFVMWGDVNGDGLSAQANDVALARAFTQFQATPTARQKIAADVIPSSGTCRGDNSLTTADIAFLRAVSFGQTQF